MHEPTNHKIPIAHKCSTVLKSYGNEVCDINSSVRWNVTESPHAVRHEIHSAEFSRVY